MKTLWSELEFAGRALIVLLALVILATPIGVGVLVQRTHAAGQDSPLDWVNSGHRTAIAEATFAAQELEAIWAAPAGFAAPTLVKGVPLATMIGGVGALKRGTPTLVPSATQGVTPGSQGAVSTPTPQGPGTSGGLKRPGPPTPTPRAPSGTVAALGTTSLETPAATSGTLVAHYVELPGGGVATLIQLPDLAILVDGGGSLESGILLDYILSQGLDHLDMAIVTRYDEAHAAELPGIIPLLAPDVLWAPDAVAVDAGEQSLFDLEAEVGGDHYTPKAREAYWYDELHIECLYASDGALAVRLTYGEMAMLFTGDADAERALTLTAARPHAEALRLSQDMAGAKGLDSETAAILMEAVVPEFAIYAGNDPRSALLDDLRASGVPVYATADYGTLRFVTDGYLYQLEAERVP
ncbi:MAG: ComEC/Rec2 family competence protein [Anaerolineae bacterium]